MYDFTIITPSFNQGDFIEQTLNSVSYQSGVTVQHIVMDGGSTDGTIDHLKKFTSAQTLSWVSELDRGQADAINKGVLLARGSYVSYLNSDDCLKSSDTLKKVKRRFEKSGADIVFGDSEIIDRNGSAMGMIKGMPFDHLLLKKFNYIPQPSTFLTREVIDQVGQFDDKLKYCMDLDYWLRCAEASFGFDYFPETLSSFRLHGESKTELRTTDLLKEGYLTVRRKYFPRSQASIIYYYFRARLGVFLQKQLQVG